MHSASFHFSFYILCIVLIWLVVRGLVGGRTIFAYPTQAAMLGLAWVVPQGIELESRAQNPFASEGFWLYVTACYVSIAAGFRYGYKVKQRQIARAPNRQVQSFSSKRLLIAAAGLTVVGQLAGFEMSEIDTSAMGTQWTGVITMWALLAKTSGFGLCLAVLVFARTRWWAALAVAAIAAVPIMQAAFWGVRREALFDLVILSAGAWYLVKRSYPPRATVVAVLLVGMVILNTVGDIRTRVIRGNESFVEVLTSKETYASFDYAALSQGESSELGLAQFDVWTVNQTGRWEIGAEHWNSLVHQYVPAFLLGRELKESLMISTLTQRINAGEELGLFALGSTRTGFSDSYRAIGIFGVLIFFAIAYYFGYYFALANFYSINAQFLYLVLIAEALKSITHSTGEFLSALPFTLVMYWLAFSVAKIRDARSRGTLAFKAMPEMRCIKGRI